MARRETDTGEGKERTGGFGWFLAGLGIGLATAFLYAPKSGRETRTMLAQKTQQGREAVSGTSREVLDAGKQAFEKSRQFVDDAAALFERGRKLATGDKAAEA